MLVEYLHCTLLFYVCDQPARETKTRTDEPRAAVCVRATSYRRGVYRLLYTPHGFAATGSYPLPLPSTLVAVRGPVHDLLLSLRS